MARPLMICCRYVIASSWSSSLSDTEGTLGVAGRGIGFSIFCKNLSGLTGSSSRCLASTSCWKINSNYGLLYQQKTKEPYFGSGFFS